MLFLISAAAKTSTACHTVAPLYIQEARTEVATATTQENTNSSKEVQMFSALWNKAKKHKI